MLNFGFKRSEVDIDEDSELAFGIIRYLPQVPLAGAASAISKLAGMYNIIVFIYDSEFCRRYSSFVSYCVFPVVFSGLADYIEFYEGLPAGFCNFGLDYKRRAESQDCCFVVAGFDSCEIAPGTDAFNLPCFVIQFCGDCKFLRFLELTLDFHGAFVRMDCPDGEQWTAEVQSCGRTAGVDLDIAGLK